MREIDEMFRNSEAQTATETEKSYFKNFFGALEGFVFVILLVTGAGRGLHRVHRREHREHGGARAHARDRDPEGARLLRRHLFGDARGRGGAARDARGRGRRARLARAHPARAPTPRAAGTRRSGPLGVFIVTKAILVQGLFLAFFVGMISGVVPSFGAARRSVAQTLREVF